MEIQLSMEILQVAMTVDEARQNGLASDINHPRVGRNRDLAATTDCLEPACLDNDDGILDRRPAGAIYQFSTLHHEYSLCHVFFPPWSRPSDCGASRYRRHTSRTLFNSLDGHTPRQPPSASRFDFHLPAANLFVGPSAPGDVARCAVEIRQIIQWDEGHILHENLSCLLEESNPLFVISSALLLFDQLI